MILGCSVTRQLSHGTSKSYVVMMMSTPALQLAGDRNCLTKVSGVVDVDAKESPHLHIRQALDS
jgi:hypothetical protein